MEEVNITEASSRLGYKSRTVLNRFISNGWLNEWVKKHLGDVAHKRLILSHSKISHIPDYELFQQRIPLCRWSSYKFHYGSIRFENGEHELE